MGDNAHTHTHAHTCMYIYIYIDEHVYINIYIYITQVYVNNQKANNVCVLKYCTRNISPFLEKRFVCFGLA
jgi:hypothetical protein